MQQSHRLMRARVDGHPAAQKISADFQDLDADQFAERRPLTGIELFQGRA